MDLEVLNLQANTESLDKAVTSIDKLDGTIGRLEKTLAQLERSFSQSMKSVAQAQKQIETASKGAASGLSYVQKQIDKTNTTLQGMSGQLIGVGGKWIKVSEALTKGQYSILATAKNTSAAAKEVKQLSSTLELLNKVTGKNPFDAAMNPLAYYKNRVSELQKTVKLSEKYNDLSQEQLRLIARQADLVRLRANAEGMNIGQREAAVKKETAALVEQMRAENKIKDGIAERNRLAQEQVRLQQEQARAAQVSAKQRADAEKYVQETLQRTLFINEQMDKGMSTSGANALYAYKQQLDLLGLSADQAAAKMQEFQSALTTKQGLQGRANPIRQMREDIHNTTQEVNQLARAVSVQLGDVFVSLAGGMNPLLVAIQQGDQIRFAIEQAKAAGQGLDNVMRGAFASMANSFVLVGTIVKDFLIDGIMSAGKLVADLNTSVFDAIGRMVGLGNAVTNTIKAFEDGAAAGNKFSAAMVGVMNVSRILAGGLLLGVVASITTLIAALVQADAYQTKLAKSLGQYGASLGVTAQQALEMAVASEYSTSKMVDAIGAVAKAGGFTKAQLEVVAESAVEMNKVFGTSIEDVVAKYKEVQKDPVNALIELQMRTGNVNQEVIESVRQLQKQGETYRAIEVAMDEYADANKRTTDQTVQNLGVIETILNRMAEAWGRFYKDIQQVATKSLQEQIDSVRGELEKAVNLADAQPFGMVPTQELDRIEGLRKKLYDLAVAQVAATQEARDHKQALSEVAAMEAKYADDINNAKPGQIKFAEKQLALQNDYNRALERGASPEFLAGLSSVMQKNADEYLKSLEKTDKVTKETTSKAEKYYDKLVEKVSDLSIAVNAEYDELFNGAKKLTDANKELLDAQNDKRWKELTEAQKAKVKADLEELAAKQELIRIEKERIALVEFQQAGLDIQKENAASIAEETKAIELRNQLLFATEKEAKKIQREYDLNIKLASIENKYIADRVKIIGEYTDKIREGQWSQGLADELSRQMQESVNQEAEARRLAHEDVNTAIREDYVAKFKEIQGTVTDIIATALFEGGKAGSKKLKDVLKQAFRNYVIRVFIDPVVGNIMGSVAGALGLGGSPGAGQGVGAGVGSLINSASSVYGMASGSTVAGISGALQGVGSFVGSGVLASFGAGLSMTTAQVAALSEAGLIASQGAAGLGSVVGAALPWVAGGLLVADLLGVFDKKPSDKTSWAVIDPSTGRLGEVGDMGGKKAAPQEQKDANVLLSQIVGGFANLAGITGELVTAMGSRDGIRVAITGGFKTPEGAAGGGAWLGGKETIYSFGSDLETAIVGMLNDLVDEGTLDQAIIDTWRNMKTEVDGTTRASGELISVLNLLTSGYSQMDIERANLLQTEGEALEQAYARMLNIENALSGVIATENAFTAAAKTLAIEFERLGLSIPTSAKALGDLVFGLDKTSSEGQALYKTLMELAPAFLEVEGAFKSNYNLLLSEQELLDKNLNDLSKTFEAIGVAMPNSTKELRAMIDAVDMTSSAGVELKAQLLSLVPAVIELETQFNSLNEAAEEAIDVAYRSLQKAVDAEKKIISDRINSLSDNLTKLKSIFDFLKNSINRLLRIVPSTNAMQISQANALIRNTVVSGFIPDDKDFENAVGIAVQGVEDGIYASRVDQERATILLSNDLSNINYAVGKQISEMEQLIEIENKELQRLDNILVTAQQQIDALKGIDDSVKSVGQAVLDLQTVLENFSASINNAVKEAKTPQATSGGIALPSDWGAYGEQQRADFFNAAAITASDLLSAGVPQSDIDYMRSHLNYKFYNGGYTGSGGMYEPAGIVHKGEVVWSQADVANAGGVAAVESLRLNGAMQPPALRFDSSNIVSAIEELRTEVGMLRAETRAIVGNTSKTARILDDVTQDGQTIKVETVA